ncbi:hypothetical protein [Noviherbaspirillum aerium]|uniref:hypothetical protein n=1 Tax=Noviherbaspirillum aerium TaxID=2588497 RepID=UPI00124D5963|nr:hypothetical protein [Noviherbaspirillum aerium]
MKLSKTAGSFISGTADANDIFKNIRAGSLIIEASIKPAFLKKKPGFRRRHPVCRGGCACSERAPVLHACRCPADVRFLLANRLLRGCAQQGLENCFPSCQNTRLW